MPVIAVINRKGGSGKSTLATHLAAYCSHAGQAVMLGDVDRQQSAQTWLRLRHAQPYGGRAITGWAVDARNVFRAPAGTTHVILDTPGGLRGLDLARVIMTCDAVLMPVCNSVFDRESAAQCVTELRTLPRVSSGRCKLAAVGMRINAASATLGRLHDWSRVTEVPLIGTLRDSPRYVDWAELGHTLFDVNDAESAADLREWQPILDWLAPLLGTAHAARVPAAPVAASAANVLPLRPRIAELSAEADVESPSGDSTGDSLRDLTRDSTRDSTRVIGLRSVLGAIPRFLQRGS